MPGPTFPVAFYNPGSLGVNYQEADQLLNPAWATRAYNMVLNKSRQLECRGAFEEVATAPASNRMFRMFVHIDAAGGETVISTEATTINKGTNVDLANAANDITSATAPTAGYWQFVNFNGYCLGFQDSHTPIARTTGDFADITASSGTLPTGDVACAAFGRVWAVASDRQTIRYSALLDHTKWAAADGGGSIDMRNVWTQGIDVVMGIAAFGSNLLVFGRRHIIIYSDGQGSEVGIDPEQIYVVDTIEGTGLVSRDTIAEIGEGDLVFLSPSGLQSLRRLVQDKDNPLNTISWQIEQYLKDAITYELEIQGSAEDDCRAFTGRYIPALEQYILTRDGLGKNEVFVFHMLERTQDDKGRELVPVTHWPQLPMDYVADWCYTNDHRVYCLGQLAADAENNDSSIFEYSTYGTQDFYTTDIIADYESGWVLFGEQEIDTALKLLKTIQITVLNPTETSSSVIAKYGFDYATELDTITANANDAKRVVEQFDCVGDVDGQYFKFGMKDAAFGGRALQSVSLYMKPTRLAFTHSKANQALVGTESDTLSNVLVAVGSVSPYMMKSTDAGVTWSSVTVGVAVTAAAYLPDYQRFVFIGTNVGRYSADLSTFTTIASPPVPAATTALAMAYSETLGTLVVIGDSSKAYNESPDVYYSTDGGATWSQGAWGTTTTGTLSSGAGSFRDVIWVEELGLFLAAGSSTLNSLNRDMFFSADGITWDVCTAIFDMAAFSQGVAWSDELGYGLAIGSTSQVSVGISKNGKLWRVLSQNASVPPFTVRDRCLTWSPTRRLFVGHSTAAATLIYTTRNGMDWTLRHTCTAATLTRNRWMPNHKRFIAVGNGATNHAAYSQNGVDWTERTAVTGNWSDVIEGILRT